MKIAFEYTASGQLMDDADAKCHAVIRELRWLDGVICPECDLEPINKRGFHDDQAHLHWRESASYCSSD